VQIPKKCIGTRYAELVLHLVRSMGPIVNSGASDPQNTDVLFFMLGWDQYRYQKKCVGTCYVKLVFLHAV
jgi:hypothetical protein